MLIKINELAKGDSFMLNSEGASTVYVTDNVTKISDCVVKIDAMGKILLAVEKLNIMNAKQAKEKALAVNTGNGSAQYAQSISMISNAATRGEYEMWFYENIKSDVIEKLISDGYNVGKPQFERNETMTKISWS